MNIVIKNYNGISDLNYNIIDNKINFLFAISGAGKSSIASALTDKNNDSHITVGKNISDLFVSVDDNTVIYSNFKVFNLNYLDNILINKRNGEDIYSILWGDGGEILQCKSDYYDAISDLTLVKEELVNAVTKICVLHESLKLSIKEKGKRFSKTSLINKMAENVSKVPAYRNTVNYNSTYLKWMKDGTSMASYTNGVCPFCSRKLTPGRKEKIDNLIIFDAKTYEKINSQNNIFIELGISMPDWVKKREIETFNNKLLKYMIIKPELEKLNTYIDIATSIQIQDINIVIEKPSKQLSELYPEIASAVNRFNDRIISIKKALGKLKKETQRVINSNIKIINEKMNLLGIPYKFVKKNIDEQNKTAEYYICHIADTDETIDRVDNLSFGERNLIGLLLFLLANKDAIGLIIDDPASSFDDYRRKVIFDMIYDLHENSSVLVLSHDTVFVKYAAFHKNAAEESKKPLSKLERKFLNETGNIDFMESYNESKIIPICIGDFGTIKNFVINRLIELPREINYQTAINLRLFYELENKSKNNEIIYGYLSAIIHKKNYSDIQSILRDKGKDEAYIVERISHDTGINYSLLSSDYSNFIDSFNYLDFEKITKCRETITTKSSKKRIIFDELSNIVHMNSAHSVCLNPYKYNYFSKYVKDYIDNN